MVFRIHIGFLVDNNGKATDFRIISKGDGELRKYAELVLERVKNMPQNWTPAKVTRILSVVIRYCLLLL